MISDVTSFNIPASNNEYKTVRICKVGVNATGASDFAEIPNTTSTSSKLNTETKENMYYGDAGKSKRKTSNAPSVEVEFVYSKKNEIHNKILEFGKAINEAGMTQIEADGFDGKTVSFIANVEVENFGPDGAPDDDATVKVNFTYAGGPILYTNTESNTDSHV